MRLLVLLTLAFAACKSTPKITDNNTGASGPLQFTPTGPKSYDGIDYTGVLGSTGAINPTAVGDACTKDYQCWLGQVCTSGKCAAMTSASKLQGEATISAAGDYMVSVYSPVDAPGDAVAGELEVTFDTFPARDATPKILQIVRRQLPSPAMAQAMMDSRLSYESSLRQSEQKALQWIDANPDLMPVVEGGPARAATCTASQFGYNGTCIDAGSNVGQFTFITPPPEQKIKLTLKFYKLVGTTAILLDADDTYSTADMTAIDSLSTKFDTIVAPRDRQFFNAGRSHSGKLDFDGNGVMTVALSKKVGVTAGLAGIFQARDMLPSTAADASGNQMDMLWAVPPGLAFTPRNATVMVTSNEDYVLGTLAHEYQHVINFGRAQEQTPVKTETLFLNESLSHLAEDITGYGASNITTVQTFLSYPEYTGLLFGPNGQDMDSSHMRGLGYLYLRYHFEKAGGYSEAADGTITDKGGLAMLEKFYTITTNGVESLRYIVGSAFTSYPLFFPAMAISTNPAVTLPTVKSDPRFNFAKPVADPKTGQVTGIDLNDATRKDAFGTDNHLVGYVAHDCDSTTKAEGGCVIYASGGVSFLWEGAPAAGTVSVKGPSANNVRLTLVKVK